MAEPATAASPECATSRDASSDRGVGDRGIGRPAADPYASRPGPLMSMIRSVERAERLAASKEREKRLDRLEDTFAARAAQYSTRGAGSAGQRPRRRGGAPRPYPASGEDRRRKEPGHRLRRRVAGQTGEEGGQGRARAGEGGPAEGRPREARSVDGLVPDHDGLVASLFSWRDAARRPRRWRRDGRR